MPKGNPGILRPKRIKQFCPKGHDTFVVGRNKDFSCKACGNIYRNKWKTENLKQYTDGINNGRWKIRGIINLDGSPFTVLDYDRLYQVQGGRCANKVCNKHQSELEKALSVDHNHNTGFVRGLLCNPCNQKLGVIEDKNNVGLIEYLKRFN